MLIRIKLQSKIQTTLHVFFNTNNQRQSQKLSRATSFSATPPCGCFRYMAILCTQNKLIQVKNVKLQDTIILRSQSCFGNKADISHTINMCYIDTQSTLERHVLSLGKRSQDVPWRTFIGRLIDTMQGRLLDVLNFFLLFFRNLFD